MSFFIEHQQINMVYFGLAAAYGVDDAGEVAFVGLLVLPATEGSDSIHSLALAATL